ncbi:MAG: SpvB/TcaC N-terminal domain-containing protein [Nitrospirales bacterium]
MMKTSIGRRFASVLVLTAFLGADLRAGYASPGDVFLTAAPAQAPSVEDRLSSEEETHSVGESGTAHYTIPITVPPGRQGMQPSLSLSYSSRNPVRGGLATGWTLNIPKIEVDTSQGRLTGIFYRSSLSGTRLVPVPEQASSGAEAFRAEFDGTYARYERVKNPDGSTRMWRMRSTDGWTWSFGEAQHSQDAPRPGAGLPAPIGRWFLSRIEDRFGNFIEYSYARAFGNLAAYPGKIKQPVDVYPTEIKWGGNAGPTVNLPHYARIVFDYDQNDSMCDGSNVPIGASFTFRQGYPLHEGAKRLTAIVVQVSENGQFQFPGPERRRYNLGYDMAELGCPTGRTHAPLRLLTSVQQIAFAPDGKPTALPPVTFEYGRRELEPVEPLFALGVLGGGSNSLSLDKAGHWPTVGSMLLDFDGDGRLDIVSGGRSSGGGCEMIWHRNIGTGTFEAGKRLLLPTIPWAGLVRNDAGWPITNIDGYNTVEDCSLSHQFSRVTGGVTDPKEEAGFPATYQSYRFMDLTGDGRPDLVTAIDANQNQYRPQTDPRLWPPDKPFPACIDAGACRERGRDGFFLVAEGGGGSEVKADRREAREWETFTIQKVTVEKKPHTQIIQNIKRSNGPIRHDDYFALLTHNGQYVAFKENERPNAVYHQIHALPQREQEAANLQVHEIFRLVDTGSGVVHLKAPLLKGDRVGSVVALEDGTVHVRFGGSDHSSFTLVDLNKAPLLSGEQVRFRTRDQVPTMCVAIATLPPGMGKAVNTPKPMAPGTLRPPVSGMKGTEASPPVIAPQPTPPGTKPPPTAKKKVPIPGIKVPIPGIRSRAAERGDGPPENTPGKPPSGTDSSPKRVTGCVNPETRKLTIGPGGDEQCSGETLASYMYKKNNIPWEQRTYEVGAQPNPHPRLVHPVMWPEYGCGRYVFRFYENTGEGFAPQPQIILSPIPLETDRDTSNVGAGHLAASSSWHGFLDMDGDGLLDAVYKEMGVAAATPLAQLRPVFHVFRGDGTGNFRGDAKGNPYQWQVPAFLSSLVKNTYYADARVKLQGAVETEGARVGIPDPLDPPKGEFRPSTGNIIQESFTKVTLQDVNGDGLPDYVDSRFSPNGTFDSLQGHVHVFYNTGVGFESPVVLPGFRGSTLETQAWGTERYGYVGETAGFLIQPQSLGESRKHIWSRTTTRLVDIDADGLLDMVLIEAPQKNRTNPWAIGPRRPKIPPALPTAPLPELPTVPSPERTPPGAQDPSRVKPEVPYPIVARLFINVGDKLVPMGQTEKLAKWWPALARITFGGSDTGWGIATDFIDLDGDGLPDVMPGADTLLGPDLYEGALQSCTPEPIHGTFPTCRYGVGGWRTPQDGQGMRLLRTINNGRGGTVQFDYEPLRAERTAGPPSGLGTPGGRPGGIQTRAVLRKKEEGRVPYPLWVVKSVTVHAGPGADGVASPPSTTEYSYQLPIYNQDNHGDWGFRGFTSVKMKSPSGAVSFTNYDYSLHWGGLPVQTQVFDADNGHPHLLTKTIWGADLLLNNKIITHHRREVETRTCRANQNLQICATNGDPRFDISIWKALAPNVGPPPVGMPLLPLLYVEEFHWAGNARNAEATAGSQGRKALYHLLSTPTEYRLLPQEEQRYVVDPQPLLVGKNIHKYDSRWLVEEETIEYPEPNPQTAVVTVRFYDLNTGNLLRVTRPNQVEKKPKGPSTTLAYDPRQLFVVRTTNELGHQVDAKYDLATGVQLSSRGPNAKNNPTDREGWDRTIDGFGRILVEKVAIDPLQNPTQPYLFEVIAQNEYHDDPRTAPAAFLGGHAGVIARKLIEFGQPRQTTTATEVDGLGRVVATRALAGQTQLAVSKFFYDAAGNLVKADLPAPDKAPGTATVPYALTYDPQGRRTSALRPDQTGQRWVYDGRSTTREDLIANKGGVVSRTRTLTDALDRLVQTVEQLTGGQNWATTHYDYDGNDNVRLIRSADGIETMMHHDWLSRRVKVIRGGQVWSYLYDKNGNMTSIVAPAPSNVPSAAFTTIITYDALDRPLTRLAGRRQLSDPQLATYGPSSTTYEYDQGMNGVGRLFKVTQPHGFMTYTYEARGLIVAEQRGFSILGEKVKDTRTMTRSYNVLGAIKSLTYADAGPNALPTTVNYTYDDRGLPFQAQWAGHGVLGQAQYTAGGLVAIRSGKLDGSIEHQTTYIHDDLGRTTQQTVKAKPHNGQALLPLSDQRYSYTGSDDVATWDTTLGAGGPLVQANWTFGYDAQHQLTQATGPLGYQAAFAYSPGGRIMSANVNVANGAKRVHRRTVSYDYGVGDPEAPDVLKLPNGQPWMSLRYDEAGNLRERNIGGKIWQHVNDGADLQREVVRPDGTRELYWYDHGRQRSLIATLSPEGVIGRVRWVFGETEIWYDRNGKVTKTLANVNMNGMLARIENGNQARFLFQSPRGDVLLALDQQWQPTTPVAADFTYGPYGESVEEKGTDSKQVLERFNGKQFDQISELAYYGYRYYDERSLTWTQADPLYRFAPDIAMDQPRRFATYAFSLNNPLRYTDPTGLGVWAYIDANLWLPLKDDLDELDVHRTLQVGGGALEVVGGLASCGGSWGGGCAIAAHGLDNIQAGVRDVRTYTAKGVTKATGSELAGDLVDIGVSLGANPFRAMAVIRSADKAKKVSLGFTLSLFGRRSTELGKAGLDLAKPHNIKLAAGIATKMVANIKLSLLAIKKTQVPQDNSQSVESSCPETKGATSCSLEEDQNSSPMGEEVNSSSLNQE